MKMSKAKTKKEAVERGLQELIRQAAQEDMWVGFFRFYAHVCFYSQIKAVLL